MSFGGMLATALAGGAQQVGEIAKGDVQNQQRLDLAKEQAAIEESMRMRLAEFQEGVRQRGALADVSGPLGDAKLAYKGKELDQTRAADVQKARDMIPVTTEASRAMIPVEQERAQATAATARDVAKANAADAGYLAAVKTVKLADPEVAAHIAQMKASANASAAAAGASAAHAGLLRAQTVGVALTNDDQKRLNDIYDGMGNVLADPKLDESERAKKLNELQQRATLIQGRSGKNASPRDPELNTDTITTKTVDPKTLAETTTVSKRVRKAGDEKELQVDVLAQARAAVASGAPLDAVNARLKASGLPPLDAAPAKNPAATSSGVAPRMAGDPEEAPIIQRLRGAEQALQKFGSTQRQRDPEGFRRAQDEVARAQQELAALRDSKPIPAGADAAAFRYAAP